MKKKKKRTITSQLREFDHEQKFRIACRDLMWQTSKKSVCHTCVKYKKERKSQAQESECRQFIVDGGTESVN